MNWTKASKYHLESDGFTIAKVFMDNAPYYQLWREMDLLGTYTSAAQAMAAAEIPRIHENGDGV